jgi:hypothetical protein
VIYVIQADMGISAKKIPRFLAGEFLMGERAGVVDSDRF